MVGVGCLWLLWCLVFVYLLGLWFDLLVICVVGFDCLFVGIWIWVCCCVVSWFWLLGAVLVWFCYFV